MVATLRRFPIKSMQGEELASAVVGTQGILGDRALAVVDANSGQVLSAKTPDLGPRLLACRAMLTSPPHADDGLPPVVIELPDGMRVSSDSGDVEAALTRYFNHPVQLLSAAPAKAALVSSRDDFLDSAGVLTRVDQTSLLDALPVSVITTSTIDRLSAARPETSFDERRFRMNVVVAAAAPGFPENAWPGQCLQVGEATRLRVVIPVPRCVLTTMAQQGIPPDPAVLRTVARENSLDVAGRGYPCAGVYASVEAIGEIHIGDVVSIVAG